MTMKKKVVVTLRAAPPASVDVPEKFPKVRRSKEEPKEIERSVVGALRLFPGVPKTVTEDELAYIKAARPDVATRIDAREYVESKRKDYRDKTEGEIAELVGEEGLEHLPFKRQVEVLQTRGKLGTPKPRSVKPKAMKGKTAVASSKPTDEKKKTKTRG